MIGKHGCTRFLSFNPLPNDKILDLSKFKAIANDNPNLGKMAKSVCGWLLNIVGKGENAGNQHFLLFLQCFQKASFFKVVKSRDCVLNALPHDKILEIESILKL